MNSLFEYYRKKIDTDTDTIYFERVKPEDITICGKSINELIEILNGLEVERITGMKLCIENINDYMELILKEQQVAFEKALITDFGERK